MLPALLCALLGPANAHKPSFSGEYDAPERAFAVSDPDISIVVYQEITCELDQLWLGWEGAAGDEAYIQLGVPVIERLEDYVPSVALLAPGLPASDEPLPFAVPDGLGAAVFHGEDADAPALFHEEFTQTDSWIWVEETLTLPADGPVYLVAWHPGGQTGKLWLATGTIEDFSDVAVSEFIEWSEAVHDFHETGRYDRVEPVTEEVCLDEAPADGEAPADKSGCATAPLSGGLALALAGLWARRRQQPV